MLLGANIIYLHCRPHVLQQPTTLRVKPNSLRPRKPEEAFIEKINVRHPSCKAKCCCLQAVATVHTETVSAYRGATCVSHHQTHEITCAESSACDARSRSHRPSGTGETQSDASYKCCIKAAHGPSKLLFVKL